MKTVTLVMKNSDQTEGRGSNWPVLGFQLRASAEQYIAEQGRYFVGSVLNVVIYDSISDYEYHNSDQLRARTIEKLRRELTEAEFKSLNLEPK